MGLSTSLSLCLSIYLSIYLCMQLSVCLPVFIYRYISIPLRFYILFAFCCFIFPPIDFSLFSLPVLEQQTLHSSSWVLYIWRERERDTNNLRSFVHLNILTFFFFFFLFPVTLQKLEARMHSAKVSQLPIIPRLHATAVAQQRLLVGTDSVPKTHTKEDKPERSGSDMEKSLVRMFLKGRVPLIKPFVSDSLFYREASASKMKVFMNSPYAKLRTVK